MKLNGYNYDIDYTIVNKETIIESRKNKRKCIWFNPSYCCSVKKNLGRKLQKIVKKYYSKESSLNTFINSNSIKLSCICLPSIFIVIKRHERKLLNKNITTNESCNETNLGCKFLKQLRNILKKKAV